MVTPLRFSVVCKTGVGLLSPGQVMAVKRCDVCACVSLSAPFHALTSSSTRLHTHHSSASLGSRC